TPQIAAFGIAGGTALLSRFPQLFELPRNLCEPLLPLLRRLGRAARWFTRVLIALLLPAPDALAEPRPLAPQLLATMAAIGRRIGLDARGIDGHASQLRQA